MRLSLKPVTSVVATIATAIIVIGAIAVSSGQVPESIATKVATRIQQFPLQHVSVSSDTYSVHRIVLDSAIRYRVRRGDSLSGIAARQLGSAGRWPSLYRANRRVIGSDPNHISTGEWLSLSVAGFSNAPVALPAPRTRPRSSGETLTNSATRVSTSGMDGFEACVIERESGGNADIWNPTGHWGLFQFSYGTWVAHGGDPGLFGKASAAYQTQIFWNTVREDGTSDWAPYDGC